MVNISDSLLRRLAQAFKTSPQTSVQGNLFKTLIESVEDGVLVLDAEGRVLHWNEGMLLMLGGLSPAYLLGRQWSNLAGGENVARLKTLLHPGLAQDQTVELEIAGLKRIFAARWRDIFGEGDSRLGRMYLLRDITEKKQRDHLRSEFLGVLSHEIKTPLQSLGLASELLDKRKAALDADNQLLVETILEDVARIRTVANDLMQVSLVDLHAMAFKLERVALSELLPSWVAPFRVAAREKEVEIDLAREPGLTWADLDPGKFAWAVSNLLSNALRVSPRKGHILVAIKAGGGKIYVEFTDQGPGVPEAVRGQIFEPFFRGPGQAGTGGLLGLGLSIAREVAEAHGGKIAHLPGKESGSTFQITLPAPTL
jgi:PAS domain S-box-containing protein